ncbi:MAG: glycosyltransferase family 4 protein [Proteobacteria bacterium]|jgi:glycosyltransferase involved in cell wall biosynthesis|nr:glycosyltransferase family 4 protein [Pseudomonadota bacterium]
MAWYFDYSTMHNWKGYPTGIPRVVDEFAKASLDNSDFKFVVTSDEHKGFGLYNQSEGKFSLDPVIFSQGDLLFCPGANWAFASQNEKLRDAKKKGAKVVQLVYDLIPTLYPYFYGPGFGSAYQNWFLECVQNVDHIVTISNQSKLDIERLKKDVAGTVPVTNLRLGDNLPIKESKKILLLLGTEFVLTVGTREYRKNHILLINVWRYLTSQGFQLPKLVIVGREGWLENQLPYQVSNDVLIKDKVVFFEKLSDQEVSWLYQNSLFTLYPSIYEGWGLPIAESLSYGKVCVASSVSSMVEIAPDLTLHAHPLSTDQWCNEIKRLLTNRDEISKMEKRIKESYRPRLWSESYEDLVEILKSV